MTDEAKLHSPIHLTFKSSLYDMWSGIVMEKNWDHFVD